MRQLLLIKFALLSLFLSVEASEKVIHFNNCSTQIVELESGVDESCLQLCLEADQTDKKYFHRKAVFKNTGRKILKDMYPVVNDRDFRNFQKLAKSLNLSGEEDELLPLFDWWKNAVQPIDRSLVDSTNPLNVLQFIACADSVRNAECLARIAGSLNITSRVVPTSGHFLREFFIQDEWRILDGSKRLVYVNLDNSTFGGFDDIVDDPFLVLRTKSTPRGKSWDAFDSIHNFSLFEAFDSTSYPEEDFSSLESAPLPSSFDLYPEEKITYHYDETPLFTNHPQLKLLENGIGIVEQCVEIAERCPEANTSFLYRSPYPIYFISNGSPGQIYLPCQNLVLSSGESLEIADFPLFELEIIPESLLGNLTILCQGALISFPTLKKEKNAVDLGVEADQLTLSYIFDEEIEKRSLPVVEIGNLDPVFDHASPSFELKGDHCEKIWWQIAAEPEFKFVIPNFEGMQNFEEFITLDKLTETFFNGGEEYYFRVKGYENGIWGNWSAPFSFRVLKPNAIKDVRFEKIGENSFELSWEKSTDNEASYLIFASNSIDFIPSIYFDKHVDSIQEGKINAYRDNDNCIATTSETSFKIDSRYPFYRIIAESRGSYSVPSPLIRVYDEGLSIPRNVLQMQSMGVDVFGNLTVTAERIPFPKAYTYAEHRDLFQLLTEDFRKNSSAAELFFAKALPFGNRTYANPYVHADTWNTVSPYFLPENHPIKAQLDRIFSEHRAILNEASLKRAKFKNATPGRFSHTVVTTHSKLKGYFVKLFTDYQHIDEVRQLMKRINGARIIKDAIIKHGYQLLCKVPNKWIYPLPPEPSPPPGTFRKNFILIAEDMDIYGKVKNYSRWRGKKMTEEKVKAVYTLLQEEGLSDSVFAFNVPFTKDGRLAFIDTEHFHNWPVKFEKMMRYLSPSMQKYLCELMKH